jgi:outer membrane protein
MKKLIIMAMLMAPVSLFAQKFGHVNAQEIMAAMPEYTTAQNEVQALQKTYEEDLTRMQDELKKKGEEYDKALKENPNMPDNVKSRREQELQDLYQRIQQSYQDNQQELQKVSQEKMQAITTKVLNAIKEVGQAGGYVYIMDLTGGGVPYISTTLSTDVTSQVKAKLGLK